MKREKNKQINSQTFINLSDIIDIFNARRM